MYVKIAREATKRIDREQLSNRRKKDEKLKKENLSF